MTAIADKKKKTKSGNILPFLFSSEKVKGAASSKLDLFESGLEKELKKDDTIEIAIRKIVKMALISEFGAKLLTAKESKAMIDTITYGIMHDTELRRQALLIIDRFASDK
ncbi:hypothetical protein ACFL52_03260 [Candidatus Margulisiibacteriota bacterium]